MVGLAGVESIPISQAPCLVTLNLLQYLTAPPPVVVSCLLRDSVQKTLGLQKPSVPNNVGRQNKRAGISAYGQVGSAVGGQWVPTSPWTLHLPPLGRLANKIYWPILCYMSLLTAGLR